MHTYTLSLEDVVTYNQYIVSSKKKTGIQKFRFILSIYFLLLGGICIYTTSYMMGAVFIAIGLLYPLIGTRLTKGVYTNVLKKTILANCSGLINAPNAFSVVDDKITIQDQ